MAPVSLLVVDRTVTILFPAATCICSHGEKAYRHHQPLPANALRQRTEKCEEGHAEQECHGHDDIGRFRIHFQNGLGSGDAVREYGRLRRHETPVFSADSDDHHRQLEDWGHNSFHSARSSTVQICGVRESLDTRYQGEASGGADRESQSEYLTATLADL
jgi:hypothetical protein